MIGAIIARKKVRDGMDNFNRRDVDAILAGWAEEGALVYPGKVSGSGRFEGKAAVRKWYENTFAQFPELKLTVNHVMVENIFDLAGDNAIAVNYDIKGKNSAGQEFESCAVNLLKIRGGKIREMRSFIFGSREEIDAIASRQETETLKNEIACPWDKNKA